MSLRTKGQNRLGLKKNLIVLEASKTVFTYTTLVLLNRMLTLIITETVVLSLSVSSPGMLL